MASDDVGLLTQAWRYWREYPVRTTLELIIFPILAAVGVTLLAMMVYAIWAFWTLLI